jgi:hypothetical protein
MAPNHDSGARQDTVILRFEVSRCLEDYHLRRLHYLYSLLFGRRENPDSMYGKARYMLVSIRNIFNSKVAYPQANYHVL